MCVSILIFMKNLDVLHQFSWYIQQRQFAFIAPHLKPIWKLEAEEHEKGDGSADHSMFWKSFCKDNFQEFLYLT